MDIEREFDLVLEALGKIAIIASELGIEEKQTNYALLAGELEIARFRLLKAGPDEEADLIRPLPNAILDICSWPDSSDLDEASCLREIAQAETVSRAYKVIRRGLQRSNRHKGRGVRKHITYLKAFTQRGGIKKPVRDPHDAFGEPIPAEFPEELRTVYEVLCRHTCCTCPLDAAKRMPVRRHCARLRLHRSLSANADGELQLAMFFSSASSRQTKRFGWNEVQVLVPRMVRKSVKFAQCVGTPESMSRRMQVKEVDRGRLCSLFRSPEDARLKLRVQLDKLQRYDDRERLDMIVAHDESISLADLLREFALTDRMKVALASILAQSVWQFYDTHWTKTRWSSETVHFMWEHRTTLRNDQAQCFTTRPHFKVTFEENDPYNSEYCGADNLIHRYTRVLSLGVMLVEIGLGETLERSATPQGTMSLADAEVTGLNKDWSWAQRESDREEPWPAFDQPKYRTAVKNCLDPAIFANARFDACATADLAAAGVRDRRKILWEQVCSPLEFLLQTSGWGAELDSMPSLPSRVNPVARTTVLSVLEPLPTPGSVISQDQRKAEAWLEEIDMLNDELRNIQPVTSQLHPIQIAVLDTGCVDRSAFFNIPLRRRRLGKFKDWVANSSERTDSDGHGTHLASLIMRIAPAANVHIARVASNCSELSHASENVAEAIIWAIEICKADIICMSFGYESKVQCINDAIHSAVLSRKDSILFFAAASNFGANGMEMFPARHPLVIPIRGTASDGEFQPFNPAKTSGEVFGTLGLEVPSASLTTEVEMTYQSGTSVATAVAVGMAGFLLHYVNTRFGQPDHHLVQKKLRTFEGMSLMFGTLAKKTLRSGYMYVSLQSLRQISEDRRWAIFLEILRLAP